MLYFMTSFLQLLQPRDITSPCVMKAPKGVFSNQPNISPVLFLDALVQNEHEEWSNFWDLMQFLAAIKVCVGLGHVVLGVFSNCLWATIAASIYSANGLEMIIPGYIDIFKGLEK